jgi:hypothetical protein
LVGGAAIGLVTLWAYRRLEQPSAAGDLHAVDLQFLLVLLAALLVSPLGWIYYVPLTLTVGLALLQRARLHDLARPRAWLWIAGLGALYLPIEATHVGAASPLLTLTFGSIYFWGVFLIWLAVASRAPMASNGTSPHVTPGSFHPDVSAAGR